MRFFLLVLVAHFLFRLWLSSFGGVHPDEAYYWVWAQKFQWGYFDHPPLIAWLISLSQSFLSFFPFPEDEAYVAQVISFRALAFFMGFVLTPFMIAKSVVFVQGKNLSLGQIVCLLTLPFILGTSQVITPDIPLLFFWSAALYVVLKMVKGRGRALWSENITPYQPYKAALLGVILACAAYSKYTAIFLALLLPVSGIGFYNSLTCAFFSASLLLPHLVWSLQFAKPNQMGMFFQMDNAFNGYDVAPKMQYLLDLWGMQLLFWGPFLFLFALFRMSKKHKFVWVLAWWTFLPLVFFSITSLRRYVEGNWPLMGAVAASVWFLSAYHRKARKIFWVSTGHILLYGILVLGLFNVDTVAQFVEPFSQKWSKDLRKPSRIHELKGWGQLRDVLFELTREDQLPIAVDRYQTMSGLLFFDELKSSEEKLINRLKIWPEARRSHFNYSPSFEMNPGANKHYLISEREKKRHPYCQVVQKIEKSEDVFFYLSICDYGLGS